VDDETSEPPRTPHSLCPCMSSVEKVRQIGAFPVYDPVLHSYDDLLATYRYHINDFVMLDITRLRVWSRLRPINIKHVKDTKARMV